MMIPRWFMKNTATCKQIGEMNLLLTNTESQYFLKIFTSFITNHLGFRMFSSKIKIYFAIKFYACTK